MENIDNSILLQFAKFSRGFRISDFDEFVQEYVGVENLDFFGRLAYPNQWQMRLTNPDIREKLIRIGRARIKNRSCWMYPLNQQEVRGFVHWLPNSITNDQLEEYLKQYGTVLFIENQERTIEGQKVESDPRYYGLMLPHGTVKEMLPHFLKINGFLCLLVVRGREPACFHCKEVGHLRANCLKYKEKLISYCNRDPNTAQPRLKPRGRRHVEVKSEVKDKTAADGIISSADTAISEREITVEDETIKPLPTLENQKNVSETQVDVLSGTEKELVKDDALAESNTKSGTATSTNTFSERETPGFVEILQQIQRRTLEDLQISLENFEKKITEKVLPCTKNQTSNKEQVKQTSEFCAKEIPTSIEMSQEDSNADTETKEDEIRSDPLMMHQGKDIEETSEKKSKKTEEISKDTESFKLIEEGSIIPLDTKNPYILMIHKALQTAKEIIDINLQIIEELEKNNIASETLSKDSATDTGQKDGEDKMQSELSMLKQAKEIVSEYITKKDEGIDRLLIQLMDDQAYTDANLTINQIQFSYEMLNLSKETVKKILHDTFGKLKERLEKKLEAAEMTLESSVKGETSPKVAEVSIKTTAILEQLKQKVFDAVDRFDKESMADIDSETSKKELNDEKIKKEIMQTAESYPSPISEDILKVSKISEWNTESEAVGETSYIASKEFESVIFKAVQENMDELHKNIRKIFTSILSKDELLPETGTVLKQLESEISEVVEEMKHKQKTNI